VRVLVQHHEALCAKLKLHYAHAGGPISLPVFLDLARPILDELLEKSIRWDWIGARVIAVHTEPNADPDYDLPLLSPKIVRRLVNAYSRKSIKNRAQSGHATLALLQAGPALAIQSASSAVTHTKRSGSDPPAASLRQKIAASDDLSKKLGKMDQ
jgi:hypothetical protein